MVEVPKTAWADAKSNGDFICVKTYSGYRSARDDPNGSQHLLPPDVEDRELGSALLDCLAHSRFLDPREQSDEHRTLFDYELGNERYSEWARRLMATYGYKTKRALFKNMRSCS